MLIEVRAGNVLRDLISPWIVSLFFFVLQGTLFPGSLCGGCLETSWNLTAFCLWVSITCAEGTAGVDNLCKFWQRAHGGCYHLPSSGLGWGTRSSVCIRIKYLWEALVVVVLLFLQLLDIFHVFILENKLYFPFPHFSPFCAVPHPP